MEKSESIKAIAAALQQFHLKVETIKRDAENPFFKNKYATLSNILEQIAVPLQESDLIFSQFPDGDDGLTTIIIHVETEQFMQSTYNMRPVKNTPQSVGSAITYARRYALGSILGLNIEQDDDGNAATGNIVKQQEDWFNEKSTQWQEVVDKINNGERTIDDAKKKFKMRPEALNLLIQLTKNN